MYFDLENGQKVEKDFRTALNLLRSTDDSSTEELRQILDALIAEKFGPTKTIAARRSCREYISSSVETGHRKGQEIKQPIQNESTKTQHVSILEIPENPTPQTALKTHASPNTTVITKKICHKMADVFVAVDRTEIPTISIPDEGASAGDGALCKICNGPRLGPFILLECQECQDVYHPLCHQPPVLDLDIYDPRLVWHCAKCVELSEAAAVVAAAGIEDQEFDGKNLAIFKNQIKDKTEANDSKEQLNFFRRTKSGLGSHQEIPSTSDQFQLRNRISICRRSAKRQTKTVEQVVADRNGSIKNPQTLAFPSTSSSGLHLRKRVGSKLTMTRGTAK